MQTKDEAGILRVLGEPNRFRIFKLLIGTGKEICQCEFVDVLGIPKYGLSRHLDALTKSGLVRSRKEGLRVYYWGCANTESAFCNLICDAIRTVKEKIHDQDLARFQKRLDIRKEGKCILGVQGKKLMKCC